MKYKAEGKNRTNKQINKREKQTGKLKHYIQNTTNCTFKQIFTYIKTYGFSILFKFNFIRIFKKRICNRNA